LKSKLFRAQIYLPGIPVSAGIKNQVISDVSNGQFRSKLSSETRKEAFPMIKTSLPGSKRHRKQEKKKFRCPGRLSSTAKRTGIKLVSHFR
jgi:hypothetical protein